MSRILALVLIISPFLGLAQNPGYEQGQLIIQFNPKVEESAAIRSYGENELVDILRFKKISTGTNAYLIEYVDLDIDLNKEIRNLYQLDGVLNVQKNHFVTLRETIPSDTVFGDQWHLKNTGQTGGTIDADIDATDAWDITTGGVTTHDDTIVVCIIESQGVDIYHTELAPNIWHNYAEIPDDGIDNDNNGYIDDFDGWNVNTEDDAVGSGTHGTRVAGMVGAKGNNTTGISGVNWNVKMMIIKGQVASNEASVIEAYDYPLIMRKKYNDSFGQEGAFVVVTNASWGIDNGDPADSPIWCAMYDSLGNQGILNVAATTNSNTNIDTDGDLPTTCPSNYLIGVTMTNDEDQRAFSGYGVTHVDLGAPGSSVLSTIPGDFWSNGNGTSFAAPVVSGAIGLAYSSPCAEFIYNAKIDPSGTALAMRDYILNNVDPIASLSGEVATGGRLNINNSINAIMTGCNTTACVPPHHFRPVEITDTTCHMVWDGFSSDYVFYIQEGTGPIDVIPVINEDTIFFDTLLPCTTYSTWVRAICGTDTSDYTPMYQFKTDGCCDNPALVLDDVTPDSITISWSSVLYATQYDFRYRKEGDVSWIATLTDTVSPIVLSSLDTCVNYEFQIKTICTDSTHGFSPSQFFKTKGCGACFEEEYCSVDDANANQEWIEAVVIAGGYSTTGSDDGYLLTQQLLCGFIPGQSYNILLTPGYSGFAFTEHFSVWVDFDQNGIFDASEALLVDGTTNTEYSGTVTIPSNATHGYTKIRIAMNGEYAPDICPPGAFFGEYEDYCAYIGLDASVVENNLEFSIHPNPVTDVLNITSSVIIESLDVYSLDGKMVYHENKPGNWIDVSNYNKGIYLIQFNSANGSTVQKFVKQ